MKKYSLLDRAKYDFKLAMLGYQHYSGDAAELDLVGYHLQQTVEKIMKYEMSQMGCKFSFVHQLDFLYQEMLDCGLQPPDWILNHYDFFNRCATQSRYHDSLVTTKVVIDMLVPLVRDYLEDIIHKDRVNNGFTYE